MERNPSHPNEESSFFSKPLGSLTYICCRNPVIVLVFSLFIALLSLYWASEHLGFKMSRLDLINPNSGFNRLWLDYIDEFGDNNEVLVVVEGKGNVEVIPVLETLSERIACFPNLFQGVLHGVDLSMIQRKGLHYVPLRELEFIRKFAADSSQITNGHWEQLAINTMLDSLAYRLKNTPPNEIGNIVRELDSFSLSLANAFGSSPSYGSPWPVIQKPQAAVPDIVAACSQNDMNYFLFPTQNGVIGFVLLKLADIDKTKLAQGKESISKLRSIVTEVREKNPSICIGLTGMPILENDEMELSNEAMFKASILALIGVGAIFMAGFGGIRHPLLALITLIVAFAWTMGYITLAIGHLNILSISFGAMLIGLGTDFSVHYLARYLDLRRGGLDTESALHQTATIVGPGILTGALTTATAFYMASFTEFIGISELGTIAGGGILFCVITTFAVFPALIMLIDGNKLQSSQNKLFEVRDLLYPMFRFPRMTLVLFIAGFVFLLAGTPKVRYDHNLLHLQPEGLESAELEQRLLNMDVEQGGKNVWFALSIADTQEELLKRKNSFAQKYPELKVEEIVSWFPEADAQKISVIESLSQLLHYLPERPPEIPVTAPETVGNALGRLQNVLMNLQITDTQNTVILKRLSEIRDVIRRMSRSEYQTRMSQYQSAVAGDLLSRLQILRSMAIPEPPTVEDLPESLVERFVGKRGKHLMRIYTTANIWNMDEMEKFVKAVRDIDPKATGSPLQTYESSLQMQQGFITAALYAFGAIAFFLFVDFRSWKASLAAILPMFLGLVMMFGILGRLDLPLNPANMIVLPLILGIGIDDGVHLIHDYRNKKDRRYRMTGSTATSILITSLTTIVGFGSMMIASHRGLQSLGRVLVIGVTCCLITSIVILPILLSLWTRNEAVPENSEQKNGELVKDEPKKDEQKTQNIPEFQYDTEETPDVYVYEEYVPKQNAKPKRLVRRSNS
ncbi:MAG: MMPL family transporter [Planctomycetaceae bacterium]|jgi:hopanoid biosynthesis associated RND transporter like protein HpnN|nr:MMPL family transporter [Planctomycetaceae bacterium]